jgi:hypothetical protein
MSEGFLSQTANIAAAIGCPMAVTLFSYCDSIGGAENIVTLFS